MARPRDPSFAPPASELTTPTLAPPRVAVHPSAGQGFSLNSQGHVPIVAKSGQWTMEYLTGTMDPDSLAAQSGSADPCTVTGAEVGDLVISLQIPDPSSRGVSFFSEPVVTVKDQVQMWYFNGDNITVDHGTLTFHFIIVHRFITS